MQFSYIFEATPLTLKGKWSVWIYLLSFWRGVSKEIRNKQFL